jgi:uncharacterized protein YbjT (DUF2867 family)
MRKEHTMAEARNETVLVYGATGMQAGPVARRLLEAGYGVRVLSRDPAKAEAPRARGATVVEGDMGDPASLRAASEGVDKVFLLVPFFVRDPADTVRYGRNAIEAARAAGVRLLVWNPSGEIVAVRTGNPSLDARAELLGVLEASGLPHIVLQPTAYMENFLGPWTAPELAERGTFAYPITNDIRMQWITQEDVAAFAVEAFDRPELASLNLKIAGPERLNGEGIAERFGRALGRPIAFRPMPPREFGAILDRAIGPGAGDAAAGFYEAAAANPELLSTAVDLAPALEKLPIRPTPLEEWVARHAAAFAERAAVPA